MGLLDDGLAFLREQRREHHASEIRYSRGGAMTIIEKATPGTTKQGTIAQSGVVTSFRIRDFLIDVADFPYTEPERGDTIEFGGRLFEVTSPPDGDEPAWRFTAHDHLTLRIHTQDIGEA